MGKTDMTKAVERLKAKVGQKSDAEIEAHEKALAELKQIRTARPLGSGDATGQAEVIDSSAIKAS